MMNYIIFDLEATCWEHDRNRINEIIEIGAVKLNERLESSYAFLWVSVPLWVIHSPD